MKKLSKLFGFKGEHKIDEEVFTITEPLVLMSGRTAADICQPLELQEEAKQHLNSELAPHEFVSRLVHDKLYPDATNFLAYGLPKPETVWWACLCVRSVPACYGDKMAAEALQAAETWVKSPENQNREAALSAASSQKFEMPTAPSLWAAMAAGWSDGKSATEDASTAINPEYLTAHAASGAILLAANAGSENTEEINRKFLDIGIKIAQHKMQISA